MTAPRVPAVDLIIAAHDPARDVARGVVSALDEPRARVTVVAHGRPASDFASVAIDDRVRIVEFADGVRSPAGPFNHGVALADAEFVAVMGSDDFLEPGALTAWLDHATTHSTDYLIATLRNQDGAVWRDPLTRPGRHDRLDAVRDRLAYRAAPLGLIRRSVLPEVPFTPGLATGEDIDLGLKLLDGTIRVDAAVGLPAYVIGADAPHRVTFEPRPAAEELRALDLLATREWVARLAAPLRTAFAVKLWRLNLVPAILTRADSSWSDADLVAVDRVASWLEVWAPGARGRLSRSEGWIAASALDANQARIASAATRARAARPADRLVTTSIARLLARDAPLRRALRLRLAP